MIAFLNQIEEGLAAVGVFLGDGDHQAQVGLGHVGFGLVGAVGSALQLVEGLVKLLVRQADELFEGAELGSFLSEGGLLVAAFAMVFQLLDAPQAGLEFLVDIAGHDDHVLEHLLLVKELRKGGLELFVELLELGARAFRGGQGTRPSATGRIARPPAHPAPGSSSSGRGGP